MVLPKGTTALNATPLKTFPSVSAIEAFAEPFHRVTTPKSLLRLPGGQMAALATGHYLDSHHLRPTLRRGICIK